MAFQSDPGQQLQTWGGCSNKGSSHSQPKVQRGRWPGAPCQDWAWGSRSVWSNRSWRSLRHMKTRKKNSHSKQKRLPVFEEYSSVALRQKFLLPSVTLILKRTGAVNRMSGLQIPSVNELRVRVICCLICIVLIECFDVNKEIQKGFIIQSGCLFWLVLLLWFIW